MLFIIVREWADVEVFHNPSYNEGEEEEGEKKKANGGRRTGEVSIPTCPPHCPRAIWRINIFIDRTRNCLRIHYTKLTANVQLYKRT